MRKITVIVIIATLFGFISCNNCKTPDQGNVKNIAKASNEYMVMPVLFQQNAAEYKALCYQAFNTAKLMVDLNLADQNIKTTKRAIILDIDETVLDNSPHQAKCILDTINYPAMWKEWCELAKADALPGAVEFLNYAVSKGIEVFYVSNRKESQLDATIKNLIDKGFPMVDKQHTLFRKDDAKDNSKEPRRNMIQKDFYIILYLGDNLADFSMLYDETDQNTRNKVTDSLYKDFGTKFIVLPNAMYGDWEMTLYDKNIDTTKCLKAKKRLELLKSF